MNNEEKSKVFKAMTRLFKMDGFVNEENLQILIDFFREQLIEEYNELEPKGEEYDGVNFNAHFDQWCVDRITYLFLQ